MKNKNWMPDFICGIATGSIAWAAILANELQLPMIYVRNDFKMYGNKNIIEGDLKYNSKVLIIEDTISTGNSVKNAINIISKQGIL